MEKITGIILAGGKSTRMGSNKAFLKLGGKTLLNRSIEIIEDICDQVIISSNIPIESKYQVVKDEINEIGPLGGMISSLRFSNNSQNVVISCDLPFITSEVINTMIKEHKTLITVPTIDNKNIEPLCAVYNKEILLHLEKEANNGSYKLHSIIKGLPHKIIDFSDKYDLFLNINNQDDYKKAEEIFKQSCS